MHTWYSGVCDEHKETCALLVAANSSVFTRTSQLIGEHDRIVRAFLSKHYGCNVRLIHSDADWDRIHSAGSYVRVDVLNGEARAQYEKDNW